MPFGLLLRTFYSCLGFKNINTKKIKRSIKTVKDEWLGHVQIFDTTLFTEKQQDEVIREYLYTLEHRYLKESIGKYVGKKIKGVKITKLTYVLVF